MTRTISTTFIATALSVAALGLAGTAQANTHTHGIAIGEPTPGQLPPVTQANPHPEPDPVVQKLKPGEAPGHGMGEATGEKVGEAIGGKTRKATGEKTREAPGHKTRKAPGHKTRKAPGHKTRKAPGHKTRKAAGHKTRKAIARWERRPARRWAKRPAKWTTHLRPPSKKSHDRFKRYCTMKDAKPSHRHKKFCERYRQHPGATGTTRQPPTGTSTGTGAIRPSTATGGSTPTSDVTATGSTLPSTATGDATAPGSTLPATTTGGSTPTSDSTATGSTRPATATRSGKAAAQAEQPSGDLPFTGLAIWQLAVVGVVLLGGGLGARRLLAG